MFEARSLSHWELGQYYTGVWDASTGPPTPGEGDLPRILFPANIDQRKARYHFMLADKYENAARDPDRPLTPDPPEPK
jgi:hypothetical protein